MKYKVTLNNRVYEVEVERGEAMLVDEYEALSPVTQATQVQAAPQGIGQTQTTPQGITVQTPKTTGQTQGTTGRTQSHTSVNASSGQVVSGTPITAPMPGNVLKILVTPGQRIAEGDALIILEAMKMENEIVATTSGTVSQILVSKGQVVNTGDILASIS